MNKQEALKIFEAEIKPEIPANDKPALSLAWGIFTDGLCRDGEITLKQYETWENPYYK